MRVAKPLGRLGGVPLKVARPLETLSGPPLKVARPLETLSGAPTRIPEPLETPVESPSTLFGHKKALRWTIPAIVDDPIGCAEDLMVRGKDRLVISIGQNPALPRGIADARKR